MHNDNDQLEFLDDLPAPEPGGAAELCWYLLIVDDDEDVHHATEFALSDLRVLGPAAGIPACLHCRGGDRHP